MFETSLLFPTSTASSSKFFIPLGILKSKTIIMYTLALSGFFSSIWGTWLIISANQERLLPASSALVVAAPDEGNDIYIDVSGAVNKPGIYQIKEGDRVARAIAAAGGLTDQADLSYLNTSFNLAMRLKDEQKVYIPFTGENNIQPLTSDNNQVTTSHKAEMESVTPALTSINGSSESELEKLPRIGPATVAKILSGRPYSKIDELVSRKIISEGVFEEIKSLIKL